MKTNSKSKKKAPKPKKEEPTKNKVIKRYDLRGRNNKGPKEEALASSLDRPGERRVSSSAAVTFNKKGNHFTDESEESSEGGRIWQGGNMLGNIDGDY